ncbi:AAA domain protein [Mycobacteroides abscessus MAB_091912_2446]|uniref:AAA domain protein n=1 Tax=Mycobacteroides abscessus MAB_091912_2446 TaxID=1335414 RepID=A0A829MBB0_9MYCO|nr:AAA domain protein [Mycobacteroides abscessus MAB_091912_2446]
MTRNGTHPQIPLQNTASIRNQPTPGAVLHWFVGNHQPGDRQHACSMSGRADPAGLPPQTPMQALFADIPKRKKVIDLAARLFGVQLHFDTVSASIGFRIGKPDLPAPNVNEIDAQYARAVGKLPPLIEQGDGIKSALGLLIPLITNANPLSIVDEPEAFLHPPQAELLGFEIGKIARDNRSQVVLATHDKNLLQGIARSGAPVSIIHLQRAGDTTTAIRLGAEDIEDLWKDVTLRYGNALDSLFHRAVVITEGDRDSHFFRAAIDAVHEGIHPQPPAHNLMFLSSYGKQNMAHIVERLRKLGVRVVTSPDLDILNNETLLRRLVVAHGGDWNSIMQLYKQATNEFLGPAKPPTIDDVRTKIDDALSKSTDGVLDRPLAQALAVAVALPTTNWGKLKEAGTRAFNADKKSATELLDALDAIGIVAVKVGELEKFVTNANPPKGPEFLPVAFAAGAHIAPEAGEHANRLLIAAGITVPETRPVHDQCLPACAQTSG